MAQFSVHDAKVNLPRLIADALAGGEVVIASGSVSVVRLVPVEPQGRREPQARRFFGALKGKVAMDPGFHEPLPGHELDGWNPA